MKIAAGQINPIIGDFEGNKNKIIEYIKKAKKINCDLIIFPEMSICGYPPKSFLKRNEFLNKCQKAVEEISLFTKDIAIILTYPKISKKGLLNTAAFIKNKKIKSEIYKSELSSWEVYNEKNYFLPFDGKNKLIDFKGKKIKLSFHNNNNESCDFFIDLTPLPFIKNTIDKRFETFKNQALNQNTKIVFVNLAGGADSIVFDGFSSFFNNKGELLNYGKPFEEELLITDFNKSTKKELKLPSKNALILKALETGLKDYFYKSGFKKAVIGSSGGIDSALAAAISARALGSENIHTVFMPSDYTDPENETDTALLAKNFNFKRDVIPIKESFEAFLKMYKGFDKSAHSITEQNIQARIRGTLLMGISNKENALLIDTGNKTEAIVGYCTLYGDSCGAVAPIGDLTKTEVWEISEYINKIEGKEMIPVNIINKAPSAELKPGQKDEDDLPEYKTADKIISAYFDEKKSPEEIIKSGFKKEDLEKILTKFYISEYKRFQLAPVIMISPQVWSLPKNNPLCSFFRG
ncbi:MAG: NAD+ synthase [Desulforegulaceae bacterium]|nr:NAD+ synthase [Desulforegulaceae bacterium]